MNCTDVNAIMDEHRDSRLTAAERSAVDGHLLGCADCAAAWLANGELLAIPVPAMSPALLSSMLGAVGLRARPAHRARRGVIVATALLAGAALAAITVTRLPERLAEHTVRSSVPAALAPAGFSRVPATTNTPAPALRDDANRPADTAAITLMVAPVVRMAPDYPPDALKRGVEGSVTLKFDVTATGVVENARVIASTDTVFDAAALGALTHWRYLPRLAEGKRVASKNVVTMIRFQLDKPGNPPPPIPRPASTDNPYLKADEQTFTATMEAALDRTAVDNFRGAELALDELRARYELSGFQEGNVWDIYAYLYLVQGNYDRAIDAYETSIAAYARGGVPSQGSWLPLANLYYARHQYDLALRTLLRYKQGIKGTPGERGGTPLADEFIARLAALGVTEATLSPRR